MNNMGSIQTVLVVVVILLTLLSPFLSRYFHNKPAESPIELAIIFPFK